MWWVRREKWSSFDRKLGSERGTGRGGKRGGQAAGQRETPENTSCNTATYDMKHRVETLRKEERHTVDRGRKKGLRERGVVLDEPRLGTTDQWRTGRKAGRRRYREWGRGC